MSKVAWIIAIVFFIAASMEIMASSSAFGDRASFLESLRLQVGHIFVLFQSGAVTMFDNFGFNQSIIARLDNYVKGE